MNLLKEDRIGREEGLGEGKPGIGTERPEKGKRMGLGLA